MLSVAEPDHMQLCPRVWLDYLLVAIYSHIMPDVGSGLHFSHVTLIHNANTFSYRLLGQLPRALQQSLQKCRESFCVDHRG